MTGRMFGAVSVWSAVCLWLIFRAVRPNFDGLLSDGYIYLLMADGFGFYGSGSESIALEFLFSHYAFPPLFPLFLAATGAAVSSPAWTFALNAGVLALRSCCALFYIKPKGSQNSTPWR